MAEIRIAADSTCDLSKELVEKYDICVFPLHVRLGEKEFSDGVDITPDEIYAWSDEQKQTPKTAAPSPYEMETLVKKLTEDAAHVICFTISSVMSSCWEVLSVAVKNLGLEDRVHVIDSENLSTGIGLQVIDAAVSASQKLPIQAILSRLEAIRPRVRASFVVDTLTYLHRGGRCSGLAAMAGSALKLHPQILVENKTMRPGKKYRGKLSKVVLDYVRDMEAALKSAVPDRVFITHSGTDESIIAQVQAYLESLHRFNEILVTRAGCVVSSHCGPGTLGVLFIAEE